MSEKKSKKSFPKGSKRKGYTGASPAICLVVHDRSGKHNISDKIAEEILDVVTEKAVKYGYIVNYTRQ